MTFIRCSNKDRKIYTEVDEVDVVAVSQHSWYFIHSHVRSEIKGKNVSLHFFIIQRIGLIVPKGYYICHRDGDVLNNKRENLEVTDHKIYVSQKRYIGTHWCKYKEKWESVIIIEGKTIHLGYFDSPEEASEEFKRVHKCYYKDKLK